MGDGNNGDKPAAPVSGVDETKEDGKKKAEIDAFRKHYHPDPREEPKDTAIVGNITKLLPANTFLMFQTLAPLATNQGVCHRSEKLMTSVMLVVLASACVIVIFTDTFQFNGKVYHGIVTLSGLWNPAFKGDPAFNDLRQYEHKLAEYYKEWERYRNDKKAMLNPKEPVKPVKPSGPLVIGPIYHSGTKQFSLKFTDVLHAVLSVSAFATITLLTAPVSTCFYPDISSTVVKTTPLLVGFVVSAVFAFTPPARNGVAHPLSPGKMAGSTTPGKPASPDPNGKDGAATTTSGVQPPGDQNSKGELLHDNGSQANTAATSSVPTAKDDAATQDLQKVDPARSPQANKISPVAAHEVFQPAADAINSAQLSAQLSDLLHSVGTEGATLGDRAIAAALHGQGLQSSYNIQQVLQLQSAEAQGSNDQGQTMKQPAVSVAHRVASIIAHLLSGVPSLVAQAATGQLAPIVAREVGTLLVEGADHGIVGVTDEVSRQKEVLVQELQKSIQPVTSLIEGVKSLEQQGYQSIKGSEDELLKSNYALQQEVNTSLQALRQPSTSLAQDFTSMFQQGSQNSNGVQFDKISMQKAAGLGTQFIDSVAHNALQQGVDQPFRRGLNEVQDQLSRPQAALNYQYQTLYQPASSVAIDIPSLAQQGSRAFNDVRSQLQQQESATAQGLNAQFQNLYQPASSVANDALSVYQQNMDGARSLATGLIQDPQTLRRQMSVLTQGPVAQFQHTVDQIHTYQPITGQSLIGSRPVQQLSAASAQEAGPSGMLTRASQSLSTSEAVDRQAEKGKSQMSEISSDASDPTVEITSDVETVVVNAGPLKVHVEVQKSTN